MNNSRPTKLKNSINRRLHVIILPAKLARELLPSATVTATRIIRIINYRGDGVLGENVKTRESTACEARGSGESKHVYLLDSVSLRRPPRIHLVDSIKTSRDSLSRPRCRLQVSRTLDALRRRRQIGDRERTSDDSRTPSTPSYDCVATRATPGTSR